MEISLLIILQSPPPGLDFGLQKGSGSNFQPVQVQRSASGDLQFSLSVELKSDNSTDGMPDFKGPFVQGPANGRFVYIDIGAMAGQRDVPQWRLKIPLSGISWQLLGSIKNSPKGFLQTNVPGTHKNGGPNCATVKPFEGWKPVDNAD